MIHWQLWDGKAEEWDNLLQEFPYYTIYQSHAWGEHRARFGWRPLRLVVQYAGNITAMVQILVKSYPFSIGIVWMPGGPLGEVDLWNDSLQHAVSVQVGARFLYCRLNSMRPYSEKDALKLASLGWKRSPHPLLSGLSLTYQPVLNEELRLKQCSSNWRHNLRRSFKRGLHTYLWNDPDANEVMKIYTSMQEYKQLNAQTSHQEIKSLSEAFMERCLLVRCENGDGNLLALRGALILGEKAWDIFAATTPAGRKVYASHAAFWELMKQCAEHKVQWYDMGGVDPVNNRGVFDFKKGAGGQDLHYLAEWEYAKPSFFRLIASRIIAQRGRS